MLLDEQAQKERYELLDQFFSLGGNTDLVAFRNIERQLLTFIRENVSDRQIEDVLKLIQFQNALRISYDFERHCYIIKSVIDRLSTSDEWDFYDLRILAATRLCSEDVHISQELLEKSIAILDSTYKDKPFYVGAKLAFTINYSVTLTQQYCHYYDDEKLRKHIETLFKKYIEIALQITAKDKNQVINHAVSTVRKGIFYENEKLLNKGLATLKAEGATEIHKLLVGELEEFNYLMHNNIANTPFNVKLAENLRKLRKKRGLTLEQLASLTDIPNQTLSQLERVDRTASGLHVYKLAEFFGITERELIGIDMGYNERTLEKQKKVKEITEIAITLTDEQQDGLLAMLRSI